MTDDEIVTLAERYCDVTLDKNGRKEYEFDNIGVVEFAKAILKKEREDFIENIESQMRRIDWSTCPSEVLDNLLFSLSIRSRND